ncbi:MAG: murein biosynthesis integral membrane protein MurJ [Deltaproteobacteria bacterium]|nr:murein biosynthesis integral membrane protein MurJ [Deltaproteobacteria bacterium]
MGELPKVSSRNVSKDIPFSSCGVNVNEEAGRLTRAAGVVGFFTLLSRMTGLLRDVVIGFLFGAHGAADAYFVAFRIPNLLRRLTAEGALTVAFIPVFTSYLAKEGKAEAVKLTQIVFSFVAIILGIVAVLGVLFAGPLTRLFAPGFLQNPAKFELAVSLTRWMFPYIFFVSLVALAMGILNALRHFMAPAVSPVLFNLCNVACAIAFFPLLDEPILGLAFGVLFGGAAQLLFQVPYLLKNGIILRFDFNFRHPGLGRLLYLMGPAAFGAAVYQINVLVSTMLASLLPSGSVSYLYYADRFLEFPVGIFAIALATAALPSFSRLVTTGNVTELRETLAYSLRLVNFICLPATTGLIVLAVPLFAIFFQRGAFDANATVNSAQALIFYSLGLWSISGTKLVAPVFYAMQDTKTPVLVGIISFVINLVVSLALMGEIKVEADSTSIVARMIATSTAHLGIIPLAHGGLALATSVSSMCNYFILLVILHRRLGGIPLGEVVTSLLRSLVNASLMALPLLWVVSRVDWTGDGISLTWKALVLAGLVIFGTSFYLFLSYAVKSPEWLIVRQLQGALQKRLKNRHTP